MGGGYALEWVVVALSCLVDDDVVPTVRLVDVDLALGALARSAPEQARPRGLIISLRTHLLSHVVPVLGRVHAGLERRGPGGGVHGRAPVLAALERLPVDEERDRVLGLRDAVVGCGGRDAGGGARGDARGDGEVLQDPAADVNVMR